VCERSSQLLKKNLGKITAVRSGYKDEAERRSLRDSETRAGKINTRRLVAALGLASTVLGVSIAYVFLAFNLSSSLGLSGYSTATLIEVVYVPIIVWGIISGALGGYISARVWERNLKSRFQPM